MHHAAWIRVACSGIGTLALLAACSTSTRDFSSSGTGGGGASGSGGGPTTGSATGGGGSGGGSSAKCETSGAVFDVLTSSDIGDNDIGDRLLVVATPAFGGGSPQAQVVILDRTINQLIVRTITTGPTPAKNIAMYQDPLNGNTIDPANAWMDDAGGLVVLGGAQDLQQVTFSLDPHNGVLPTPQASALPTPGACFNPGHPEQTMMAKGTSSSDVKSLVKCVDSTSNASLWLGDGSANPAMIASGVNGDPKLDPKLFAFVKGTYLAAFGGDLKTSTFSFGPDAASLAVQIPVALTSAPAPATSFFFAWAPLPTADGIALFGASIDPSVNKGDIWGGSLKTSAFSTLGMTPPPSMKSLAHFDDITKAAGFDRLALSTDSMVGAGSSFTSDAVMLSWLKRDGSAILLDAPVYAATTTTIVTAGVAPLDSLNYVVVWIESDGASPPKSTVRGQKMICIGG